MAYGRKYNVAFTNDLNELIEIYFDFLGYTGLPKALTAAGNCLNLKATTGDEDKMQSVIGTEADIQLVIKPGDNVTIADFISPQDNYIRVTVYCDRNYANCVFQGFIVVEDNSQPFLDAPFTLSLRALDSLGMLQGIYFLDTNGNTFSGKQTIIGWLAQILNQTFETGLQTTTLNLRTYFNIFNSEFYTNQNPLEQICLDAISFETGQQTPAGDVNPADYNTGFDDYYTVLTKIVKNLRCKLFQEDGYWHLVSLWEYLNPAGYTYYEYSFGPAVNGIIPYTLVGSGQNVNLSVSIGKTQTLQLVKEDAVMFLKLATKSVELTYNYNQSLNKIINQTLAEGVAQPAQNEVIPSNQIDTTYNKGVSIDLNTDAYSCYGFTPMQFTQAIIGGKANSQPNFATMVPAAASEAFIRVVLDNLGQELLRFMVQVLQAAPTVTCLQCSPILLDVNDVLQVSFSWRTRNPTSIGNEPWAVVYCFLAGDDGSFWAMQCIENGTFADNPSVWVSVNSLYQNVDGTVPACTSTLIPSTILWNEIEVNTQALNGVPYAIAPVSGTVMILLSTLPGPGTEYWFKDISIKVLPYLNGAYLQLQGDYNYAESNANILQTDLETVDISDSPKRYFQGALLSNASGDVLLPAAWFRSGFTELLRFGQLMAYLVYTHFYRVVQKIEGTVKGLNYPDQSPTAPKHPAGLRNAYFFPDADTGINVATPGKRYMLTSFDKDYNTGQWRGVFIETTKDVNDPGIAYPDFWEFSFLYTGL